MKEMEEGEEVILRTRIRGCRIRGIKSVKVMQKRTIRHVNTEDAAAGRHRGGHEGQTSLVQQGRGGGVKRGGKQKGKSGEDERSAKTEGKRARGGRCGGTGRDGEGVTEAIRV